MAEDTPPPIEDDDIPKASARTSIRTGKDVAGSFRTNNDLHKRSTPRETRNNDNAKGEPNADQKSK